VIAELPSKQEATELAERILESIDRAIATKQWVELGDRLVRPDAIESVDVELAE
jgi:hypothetical protein